METAIKIENLSKRLSTFHLSNVSFSLPKGTIMGFIGENGAGKTTTIKCILNLLKKDYGTISIFEQNHKKNETQWKEEIGVVLDELHFPHMLQPIQINKIMRKTYKNWDEQYFFQLLQRLNVQKNKKVKDLSRGMKMKLAISVALSHHPKLLILDEPTSGLDPIVRDELLDLFLEFMQDDERSILFSSHITTDLEKIADYITFIHEGEILFSESKDTLLYELGIWKGTKKEAIDLPKHAIISKRENSFGIELLVKTQEVSPIFELTKPTIEDIMLFYVKGDVYDGGTLNERHLHAQ